MEHDSPPDKNDPPRKMLLMTQLTGQQGHLEFHFKDQCSVTNSGKQAEQLATGTISRCRHGDQNLGFLIIWLFKPCKDYLTYLGGFWLNISLCSKSWSKLSFPTFPLFRSNWRWRSGVFIHQKTSGSHFIRRLLCFLFLIPTDWSVFFLVCWLGMTALPAVARGLPDWWDSFRGKRAECFWVWVWNTGWRGRVSSQKYTLWRICSLQKEHQVRLFSLFFFLFFFLPVLRRRVSQKCKTAVCRCFCTGPGDTAAELHCKDLEAASSKYRWGNSFDCVREDSIQ